MLPMLKEMLEAEVPRPVGEFTEQWGKVRSPDDFGELVYFSYAMNPQK